MVVIPGALAIIIYLGLRARLSRSSNFLCVKLSRADKYTVPVFVVSTLFCGDSFSDLRMVKNRPKNFLVHLFLTADVLTTKTGTVYGFKHQPY